MRMYARKSFLSFRCRLFVSPLDHTTNVVLVIRQIDTRLVEAIHQVKMSAPEEISSEAYLLSHFKSHDNLVRKAMQSVEQGFSPARFLANNSLNESIALKSFIQRIQKSIKDRKKYKINSDMWSSIEKVMSKSAQDPSAANEEKWNKMFGEFQVIIRRIQQGKRDGRSIRAIMKQEHPPQFRWYFERQRGLLRDFRVNGVINNVGSGARTPTNMKRLDDFLRVDCPEILPNSADKVAATSHTCTNRSTTTPREIITDQNPEEVVELRDLPKFSDGHILAPLNNLDRTDREKLHSAAPFATWWDELEYIGFKRIPGEGTTLPKKIAQVHNFVFAIPSFTPMSDTGLGGAGKEWFASEGELLDYVQEQCGWKEKDGGSRRKRIQAQTQPTSQESTPSSRVGEIIAHDDLLPDGLRVLVRVSVRGEEEVASATVTAVQQGEKLGMTGRTLRLGDSRTTVQCRVIIDMLRKSAKAEWFDRSRLQGLVGDKKIDPEWKICWVCANPVTDNDNDENPETAECCVHPSLCYEKRNDHNESGISVCYDCRENATEIELMLLAGELLNQCVMCTSDDDLADGCSDCQRKFCNRCIKVCHGGGVNIEGIDSRCLFCHPTATMLAMKEACRPATSGWEYDDKCCECGQKYDKAKEEPLCCEKPYCTNIICIPCVQRNGIDPQRVICPKHTGYNIEVERDELTKMSQTSTHEHESSREDEDDDDELCNEEDDEERERSHDICGLKRPAEKSSAGGNHKRHRPVSSSNNSTAQSSGKRSQEKHREQQQSSAGSPATVVSPSSSEKRKRGRSGALGRTPLPSSSVAALKNFLGAYEAESRDHTAKGARLEASNRRLAMELQQYKDDSQREKNVLKRELEQQKREMAAMKSNLRNLQETAEAAKRNRKRDLEQQKREMAAMKSNMEETASVVAAAGTNPLQGAIGTSASGAEADANADEQRIKNMVEKMRVSKDALEKISLDDICGLPGVKSKFEDLIDALIRQDLNQGRLPLKGALLFGAPGTGKTTIAKAIAYEANATFFNVSSATLSSRWHGEDQKIAKALWQVVREASPSVVFFDEVDSVAADRNADESNPLRLEVLTQLLLEMDGVESSKPVNGGKPAIAVIAATNRPYILDDAFIRRLGRCYKVPMPRKEDRFDFFNKRLAEIKDEHLLNANEVEKLADITDGYSLDDIGLICEEVKEIPRNEAKQRIGRDHYQKGISVEDFNAMLRKLTYDDYEGVIKRAKPTVKAETLALIEAFDNEHGYKALLE